MSKDGQSKNSEDSGPLEKNSKPSEELSLSSATTLSEVTLRGAIQTALSGCPYCKKGLKIRYLPSADLVVHIQPPPSKKKDGRVYYCDTPDAIKKIIELQFEGGTSVIRNIDTVAALLPGEGAENED